MNGRIQREATQLLRDVVHQVEQGALSTLRSWGSALASRAGLGRPPPAQRPLTQAAHADAPEPTSRQRRLRQAIRALDEDARGRALATAGGQAYLWVEAVIAERKRVLDPACTTVEQMAHAAMFALALRNVVRSAELARQVLSGDRKGRVTAAIKNFDERVADAKHVRDVLDHFDDYALGVGDHPTLFSVFYERGADDHYVLHVGDVSLDLREAEAAAVDLATVVMLAETGD